MVSNPPQTVKHFLSEVSPKDKKWDAHKTDSVQISNILALHKDFLVRAYNLNTCADWLHYEMTDNPDKPLVLSNANFCRDRACPICTWRRALRWVATLYKQIEALKEKYPTHRWLFLTLTVRNCEIGELRPTTKAMNKAFNALFRKLKKRMPEIGYIKTIEVTRGADDSAHPHFHVMLFVPASYFKGQNYIKQIEWVELWQEALKVDYAPNVDIRAVKNKSNKSTKDISSAIAEVMKYSIKPTDLIKPKNKNFGNNVVYKKEDYQWTYEYFRQVKGLRFISVGGILKGIIKAEWQSEDEKNEDLIHVSDEEKTEETKQDKTKIIFNFDRLVFKYVHS